MAEGSIDIVIVIHRQIGGNERFVWIATENRRHEIRTLAQEFVEREELAFTQQDADSVIRRLEGIERNRDGKEAPGDYDGTD